MAKKPTMLSATGSAEASAIYSAVGVALSYWEAAEDALLALFQWLCGDNEPVAVATYIEAPRSAQTSMLDLALQIYSHKFSDEERGRVAKAIARLKKIASVRNEIAHGYVTQINMSKVGNDGRQEVVADGNYLLPSLNEGVRHERTFRFHHTAESIAVFTEDVRDQRWAVIEAHTAAAVREQDENMAAEPDYYMQRVKAVEIVTRRIKPSTWSSYMRPLSDWPVREKSAKLEDAGSSGQG